MATVPKAINEQPVDSRVKYPTSDGLPMAETDLHRDDMTDLINTLKMFYAGQEVYVSGNILLYYKPGNRRKHVAPDVLVAKGLKPDRRDCYQLWVEGKPPDVVIEVTSESTREEDMEDKFELYRDVIGVKEYFLFDPRAEYLDPPLQGFRLRGDRFVPIEPVEGRLPSEELGLHLERYETELRLYDPRTGRWLPTEREAKEQAQAARLQAEGARQQAEAALRQAETARQQEAAARRQAEAEVERLRREIEVLTQAKPGLS